ncbi:RalBP1-associated Eps domain-containing protein 1 [Trichoplax sp. H2]|nr:RalBP1-associated Eps domain-containing protein 1 [Trichoplax sp. H2]|eukprot:RDD41862.1 RalBP1-associated Eps domain-containing protein 1 [Trichoplax sp. H2]
MMPLSLIESQSYGEIFERLDIDNLSQIQSERVKSFIKAAGLDDNMAAKILQISGFDRLHFFNQSQFSIVLRLIAMAQNDLDLESYDSNLSANSMTTVADDNAPPLAAIDPGIVQAVLSEVAQDKTDSEPVNKARPAPLIPPPPTSGKRSDQVISSSVRTDISFSSRSGQTTSPPSMSPPQSPIEVKSSRSMTDSQIFTNSGHSGGNWANFTSSDSTQASQANPGWANFPLTASSNGNQTQQSQNESSQPVTQQQGAISQSTSRTSSANQNSKLIEADRDDSRWEIKSQQRDIYEKQFLTLVKDDETGLVSGAIAKNHFLKSKLDKQELSKIWKLADVNMDNALNLAEFCIAMHLVICRKHGLKVPDTLPTALEREADPFALELPIQSDSPPPPSSVVPAAVSTTPAKTTRVSNQPNTPTTIATIKNTQVTTTPVKTSQAFGSPFKNASEQSQPMPVPSWLSATAMIPPNIKSGSDWIDSSSASPAKRPVDQMHTEDAISGPLKQPQVTRTDGRFRNLSDPTAFTAMANEPQMQPQPSVLPQPLSQPQSMQQNLPAPSEGQPQSIQATTPESVKVSKKTDAIKLAPPPSKSQILSASASKVTGGKSATPRPRISPNLRTSSLNVLPISNLNKKLAEASTTNNVANVSEVVAEEHRITEEKIDKRSEVSAANQITSEVPNFANFDNIDKQSRAEKIAVAINTVTTEKGHRRSMSLNLDQLDLVGTNTGIPTSKLPTSTSVDSIKVKLEKLVDEEKSESSNDMVDGKVNVSEVDNTKKESAVPPVPKQKQTAAEVNLRNSTEHGDDMQTLKENNLLLSRMNADLEMQLKTIMKERTKLEIKLRQLKQRHGVQS